MRIKPTLPISEEFKIQTSTEEGRKAFLDAMNEPIRKYLNPRFKVIEEKGNNKRVLVITKWQSEGSPVF